jgi:hypothetical protein
MATNRDLLASNLDYASIEVQVLASEFREWREQAGISVPGRFERSMTEIDRLVRCCRNYAAALENAAADEC